MEPEPLKLTIISWNSFIKRGVHYYKNSIVSIIRTPVKCFYLLDWTQTQYFTKRKAPKHLYYSITQLNGLEHLNLTSGNPYPLIIDPVYYGANYDRCRNIPVDPILLRLFVMRLSYRRTTSRDTVTSEGSEGREWLPGVLQGTEEVLWSGLQKS